MECCVNVNPGGEVLRSGRKVRAIWIVSGVVGAGLLGYGAFRAATSKDAWQRAAESLPQEVAAARLARLPIDTTDLDQGYVPSEAENAAPLYRQAAELYQKLRPRPETELFDAWRAALSEKTPAAMAKANGFVDILGPALTLVCEAGERPACHFGTPGGSFEHDLGLKDLMMLSVQAALVSAAQGRTADMRKYLVAAAAISSDSGEEGSMDSLIWQHALDQIVCRGIEQIASMAVEDGGALTQLREVLAGLPQAPDLQAVMRTEMALNLRLARTIKDTKSLKDELGITAGGEQLPWLPPVPRDIRDDAVKPADLSAALQSRLMAFWRAAFAVETDEARLAALISLHRQLVTSDDPVDKVVAWMVGPFDRLDSLIKTGQAQHALLRAKIDLLLYRVRHGRLPEKLDQLDDVPRDPYTGQPIRYRRQPGGFTIWASGSPSAPPAEPTLKMEHPLDARKDPATRRR